MSFQTIDSTLLDSFQQDSHAGWKVVSVRKELTTDIYVFFIESGNGNLVYRKSTDGGVTFGAQVLIKTGTSFSHESVSVWFDKWTPDPGSGGTVIHILDFINGVTTGQTRYFGLETATDSFVTNNDTQIQGGGDQGGSRGSHSIIKATNGDFFINFVSNTSTAQVVFKSTDSGATWAIAAGAGAPGTSMNFLDKAFLLPLGDSGSNIADIIMIIMRRDDDDLAYAIYNNTTDLWPATFTVLEAGPTNPFFSNHMHAGTIDKTTGDAYLVYNDDDLDVLTDQNMAFRKFDNTARTWGSKILISGDSGGITVPTLNTYIGPAICRDPTNGILLFAVATGDLQVSTVPVFALSSDEGLHWSDPFFVPGLGDRDIRKVNLPAVMVDPLEGWYATFGNQGNQNLLGFVGPQALEFFSGTVTRRANPPTIPQPIENIPVRVEGTVSRQSCGKNFGKNRPLYGFATSNNVGAYKCAVMPLWPNESGTLGYQAHVYNTGGTPAGDLMDMSREGVEDP